MAKKDKKVVAIVVDDEPFIPDDEFHKRIASIKLNPEWFTERISIPSPMREFYLWFESKDNGKKKRP